MVLLLGKALTLKCHHIGRGPSLETLSLLLPPHKAYTVMYIAYDLV